MVCILLCLLTSSCSTIKDSLLMGVGSGAIGGATVGVLVGKKKKDALIGMAVGALLVGGASYFIHKGLENRDQRVRKETLLNLERFDVLAPQATLNNNNEAGPALTMPVVESRWINPQNKGKKLVEGHREWVISEDAKLIPTQKSNNE